MSDLHLHNWHETAYGLKAEGYVEAAGRIVEIAARQPFEWSADNDEAIVFANGWTTKGNSSRVPAIAATAFNYRGITVNYSNRGSNDPIAHNVEDIVAVIEASAEQSVTSATGLSMGGGVTALALKQVGSKLKNVNLVAPALFIRPEYYTKSEIGRRALELTKEVKALKEQPANALYLAFSGLQHCWQRRRAVLAEILELVDRDAHEEYVHAMSQPHAPYVRLVRMKQDSLVPSKVLDEHTRYLPFDDRVEFEGYHGRFAYDPAISYSLFSRDARRIGHRIVPADPEPLAA